MKISCVKSHLGGLEWLQIHFPSCLESLGDEVGNWLDFELLGASGFINIFEIHYPQVSIHWSFDKIVNEVLPFYAHHLARYISHKIEVGIEILPMKSMQAQMSSGPGYYEGALYDLARQGRGVPAVPLVLIGLEP